MKKLLAFICIVLVSQTSFSQVFPDSVYVVVSGDQTSFWDINAERNCGAIYDMIITREGNTFKWLQNDTGDVVYCWCVFDLFATIDTPEPGDYDLEVYYNTPEIPTEIFVGSAEFTVSAGPFSRSDTVPVVGAFQSECLSYLGSEEELPGKEKFIVWPNPVSSEVNIDASLISGSEIRVELYDIAGHNIRNIYVGKLEAGKSMIKCSLPPEIQGGLYLIKIIAENQVSVKKIMVVN